MLVVRCASDTLVPVVELEARTALFQYTDLTISPSEMKSSPEALPVSSQALLMASTMTSTASLHDLALVRSSAGSVYLDPFRTRAEPTGKALNAANEVSFDSVRLPEIPDLDVARVCIISSSLLPTLFSPPGLNWLCSSTWELRELADFEMSTGLFRYE